MNEELRARTDELDETSTYMQTILSSVPAGLVVLDAALTVRTWNASIEDLFGLRADEAIGASFFELDFGLPTEVLGDLVRRCLLDGQQSQVRIEAINRLGRPLSCSVDVSRVGQDGGGVVLSITDAVSA
jgi:two-component system CheB/CheR fusion protein